MQMDVHAPYTHTSICRYSYGTPHGVLLRATVNFATFPSSTVSAILYPAFIVESYQVTLRNFCLLPPMQYNMGYIFQTPLIRGLSHTAAGYNAYSRTELLWLATLYFHVAANDPLLIVRPSRLRPRKP
jgi:hypothetical protein